MLEFSLVANYLYLGKDVGKFVGKFSERSVNGLTAAGICAASWMSARVAIVETCLGSTSPYDHALNG